MNGDGSALWLFRLGPWAFEDNTMSSVTLDEVWALFREVAVAQKKTDRQRWIGMTKGCWKRYKPCSD